MKRRQEDEERRRAEELAAQEAALAALHSPPDESRTDQYVLISCRSTSNNSKFSLLQDRWRYIAFRSHIRQHGEGACDGSY